MVEYSPTLDSTYAALSHPVRRDLIERLSGGPMRVTELAEPFDISLAAISKHVGVLERAELVHRRIKGRDHVISLEPRPLRTARDWIDAYRPFWESRIDALEAELRNRKRP
jgi:DNA-binding transcriptional ArsR family regulator